MWNNAFKAGPFESYENLSMVDTIVVNLPAAQRTSRRCIGMFIHIGLNFSSSEGVVDGFCIHAIGHAHVANRIAIQCDRRRLDAHIREHGQEDLLTGSDQSDIAHAKILAL